MLIVLDTLVSYQPQIYPFKRTTANNLTLNFKFNHSYSHKKWIPGLSTGNPKYILNPVSYPYQTSTALIRDAYNNR